MIQSIVTNHNNFLIVASNLSGDVSYTFASTVSEGDIAKAYNNPEIKVFRVYDENGNVCYVPKMRIKVTIVEPKNEVELYAYSQTGDKRKIMLGLIKERRKEKNKPFASIEILENAYQRYVKNYSIN